jgi:hypothetical protein
MARQGALTFPPGNDVTFAATNLEMSAQQRQTKLFRADLS